jgi:hypothetical protein
MAQGTSGYINAGQLMRDVTAEIGAVLVVRHELPGREETTFGEGGIEAGSGVTFAQHEAVAHVRLWRGGIDVQNAAVEDGEDVRAGENRSDVGPAAYVGHAKSVGADAVSELTSPDETCRENLAIHLRGRPSMT